MRFSVLLCFVLATFAANGQRFSWGIKAGANVNDIYIVTNQASIHELFHPTTSFHGGLYGQLRMGKKFSFIPELQFIQKGFLIRNPVFEVKYRINYMEIPLLLSYSVFKYLNIDVGQVNGFKISANSKHGDDKHDLTDNYYTYDFGLTAGIRVNFNKKISLSSRYVWSLNTMSKTPLGFEVYKESHRNILFSLTYLLNKERD